MDFLRENAEKAAHRLQAQHELALDAALHRPEEPGHAEQKRSEGGGGLFNQISGAIGGKEQTPAHHEQAGPGGLLGKLHGALGGGAKGEANEDHLDKAVDWVQEHVLKEGQQSNETIQEQAKDEYISDSIRKGFKNATGKEFLVPDKGH